MSGERLILVGILVPFLIVHLLFAIDRDAGAFLTIAQGILDGYMPYRDLFDHKPPGIYYILAVPLALSNGSIWGAKVFLSLMAIVVLILIAKAIQAASNDSRTVWWGVCLGALGWIVYQGYTLVTETMVAWLVAAIMVCLLRVHPRWEIAGVLTGLAILFKQPAVLFLFPVLFYAFVTHSKLWGTLGGFWGILAVSVLLLTISGIALPAFQQIIWVNIGYVQDIDLRETVKGVFSLYFVAAPLWAAALLPIITRHKDSKIQFLAGMLIAAWLPALLHPTSHYLLPAVPVGAILAAWGAREVEQNLPDRLSMAPILLLILPLTFSLIFPTLATFSHLFLFQQIQAGHILANLTAPDEPILVIGAEPQYYFLAHRYPPGKDLYLLPVNYQEQKELEMIGYLRSGWVNIVAIADTPPTPLYAARIRAYVEEHCSVVKELPVISLTIWTCKALP